MVFSGDFTERVLTSFIGAHVNSGFLWLPDLTSPTFFENSLGRAL